MRWRSLLRHLDWVLAGPSGFAELLLADRRRRAPVRSNDSPTEAPGAPGPSAANNPVIVNTEDFDMSDSAAETLDAIRQGSNNLLLGVKNDLIQVESLLAKGDFIAAHAQLQQAHSTLGTLAFAQRNLGIVASGKLTPVSDLVVGSKLTYIGEVTEIEEAMCDDQACPGHYRITVDESIPLVLEGDAEVYVED